MWQRRGAQAFHHFFFRAMLARHGSVSRAGADGVNGDAVRADFAGEGFDESHHSGFRRGVVGELAHAVVADTRGEADNSPALLRAHRRYELAAAQKVTADVDVDRTIPIFFAQIDHR